MGVGPDLANTAVSGRKLIAVVYADMVGYSRLIGQPARYAACALYGAP